MSFEIFYRSRILGCVWLVLGLFGYNGFYLNWDFLKNILPSSYWQYQCSQNYRHFHFSRKNQAHWGRPSLQLWSYEDHTINLPHIFAKALTKNHHQFLMDKLLPMVGPRGLPTHRNDYVWLSIDLITHAYGIMIEITPNQGETFVVFFPYRIQANP